jgi:hypothetical protein
MLKPHQSTEKSISFSMTTIERQPDDRAVRMFSKNNSVHKTKLGHRRP